MWWTMVSKLSILGIPIRIDWSRMEVGMSFFLPAPTGLSAKLSADVLEASACAGYKVFIAEVKEGGCMGIRVWRVA